jgi:DnaJ-domain-containing protein 1
MESHFEVAGSCATSHDGYEAIPSLEQNRPKQVWKFVDEFQQLLGHDSSPDPQFFVESWTFGLNAAVDNYQQRRRKNANRERQSGTFEDFDDMVNLSVNDMSMNQDSEVSNDYPHAVEASMYTGNYETGWKLRSSEEVAAPMQSQVAQDGDAFEEESAVGQTAAYPMTLAGACELLEVTASSTRQQIRAAYRRKVSQWHPDRLDRRSEDVRQRATAQMAAINEAYRLLCNGLV